MEKALWFFSFVLPILFLLSLSLVVIVNVYLKLRRQYPIKVNCWFCNQWTYVAYDNQNSFECPTCLQYNGFTDQGDYNKPIPAQYDELLNMRVTAKTKSNKATNGLCQICNNNQKLKYYQLANFVPMRKEDYDVEVEHFEKQLEKAYKLCSACKKVVKTTIQKQNCLLGLKFSQMRRQGLKLLDLGNPNNPAGNERKRSFLLKAIFASLCFFTVLNLIVTCEALSFYKGFDRESLVSTLLKIEHLYQNTKSFIWNQCGHVMQYLQRKELMDTYYDLCETIFYIVNTVGQQPFLEDFYKVFKSTGFLNIGRVSFDNPKLLCPTAFLMQLILLVWDNGKVKNSILTSLWFALNCLQFYQPMFYTKGFQALGTICIVAVTLCPSKFSRKTSIRKETVKSSYEDFSDVEEDLFEKDESILSSSSSPKLMKKEENKIQTENVWDPKDLEDSFTTARCSNKSLPDTASYYTNFTDSRSQVDLGFDLDLNRLNLGSLMKEKKSAKENLNLFVVNNNVKRPKPVLSPPKLNNVTQNSWLAGGYWKNPNGIPMPTNNLSFSSRSSSQSSGIGSQVGPCEKNYWSENHFCYDHDYQSLGPAPVYYLSPNGNGNVIKNRLNCSTGFSFLQTSPVLIAANYHHAFYSSPPPVGPKNPFAKTSNEFNFEKNNLSRSRGENSNWTKNWLDVMENKLSKL